MEVGAREEFRRLAALHADARGVAVATVQSTAGVMARAARIGAQRPAGDDEKRNEQHEEDHLKHCVALEHELFMCSRAFAATEQQFVSLGFAYLHYYLNNASFECAGLTTENRRNF